MNKVFAFNYKGYDYFSFAGVPVAEAPKHGANVITKTSAFQDEGSKRQLLQWSVTPAKDLNEIPVMQDAVITKGGEYFNLKGTLSIDGAVYDVVVTDTDTIFTARDTIMPDKSPQTASEYGRTNESQSEFGIASLKLKLGGSKSQFGLRLGTNQSRGASYDVSEVIHMMTQDQLYQLYQELDKRFGKKIVETSKAVVPTVNMDSVMVAEEKNLTVPEGDTRSIEEEFLSSLKPEVAAVIQDIPYELIKECTVSTSKDIDSDGLKRDGAQYCKANNWQLCLDYYAIDNLVTMERYFYNRKTDVFTAVPMRVIQKWRRIISE